MPLSPHPPTFLPPAPVVRPPHHRSCLPPRRPPVCLGQTLSSPDRDLHPVLSLLRTRLLTSSRPGARARGDTARVALCIEGGGMRGAVGAGMVAAIQYIGLHDSFDAVYGTSAGAVVGSYFVAGQVPMYGARIYYDALCAPERRFIDLRRLRHHPYLRRRRRRRGDGGAAVDDEDDDDDDRRDGRRMPVLNLDTLVDDVLGTDVPLDWAAFDRRQQVQPLHAVATSLRRLQPVALTGFDSRVALSNALRASARVPGIAGPPVLYGTPEAGPLADGLLVEGIPFRSARAHGCTHALALCTRPRRVQRTRDDGAKRRRAQSGLGLGLESESESESGSGSGSRPRGHTRAARAGLYELLIARPYLRGAAGLDEAERAVLWAHVSSGSHHAQYRRDMERLTVGNRATGVDAGFEAFAIAPDAACAKVGQLETRARRVFQGVRDGFAAAYDALSPFAGGSGDAGRPDAGRRVAELVFPEAEIAAVERRHRAEREVARAERELARAAQLSMSERYLVG